MWTKPPTLTLTLHPRYACATPAVGFHLADPAADGIVDTATSCVPQSSTACFEHMAICTLPTGPDITKLACNTPMPKYYVDRHGHAKGAS